MQGRIIGIRHRCKITKDNEAHPTMLCILDNTNFSYLELETESDELDWLKCDYPVKYRDFDLTDNDNVQNYKSRHLKWKKITPEKADGLPLKSVKIEGRNYYVLDKVPTEYDGLKPGDTVVMILGGSGDRLAAALATRGEAIGAKVFRVPTKELIKLRGWKKEKDHEFLVRLWQKSPEVFYLFRNFDREIIEIAVASRDRAEALKAKVACENRVTGNLIGSLFLNPDGQYPDGEIDQLAKEAKANDEILQNLIKHLAKADKALEKAVTASAIWTILEPIKGVGPRIAADLIASIGDIRRFATDAKLKKFCGVHVIGNNNETGIFPRKRRGIQCDWNGNCRQALYLLGDQFNRRPDSQWGEVLISYKKKLRQKYPGAIEVENGKGTKIKKYTNGHIHKMAIWKTLSKFVEGLWKAWWEIEKSRQVS
jgi:hypothetical protein